MPKKYITQVFVLLLLLLITSCERDLKESIQFNHEILEKSVLQEIKEYGIELTKDEYGNYWYSVNDKEDVNQIVTLQTKKITNSVEITDDELSVKFEENLNVQNIHYALDKFSDDRKLYVFEESQLKAAKAIFHESMKQHVSRHSNNIE